MKILNLIAEECSEVGWDGYQALPVDSATCERTKAFLENLPSWIPSPEIVPESDGELAVEWYHASGPALSISIGKDGPLHYAALFGNDQEVQGVEPFIECVPRPLVELISEFVRSGSS